MAQITKENLKFLASEEIRNILISDTKNLPSPIKEYVGVDLNNIANRIERVKKLLNIIIVERFINGEIN